MVHSRNVEKLKTTVLRADQLSYGSGVGRGGQIASHNKGGFVKSMKLASVLAVLMLLALTPAFAAPVGVATISGVYSFQVIGVSPQYGYYSGSTWVSVNGTCPNKNGCINLSFAKISVGTISFDGKGHAEFLTFANYGEGGGGSGGPKVGVLYPYAVSGQTGSLTVTGTNGGVVSLTLGSFNASGIATVVQFLIPDTNPSIGTAVLK
jgi:hypothetical protein